MQPHSSFDALSRVIERLGTDGRTVRRAEAAASADGAGRGSLHATVDVAIPVCDATSSDSALDPTSVSVDDGDLTLSVQLPVFPDASADDTRSTVSDRTTVSAHSTDARFDDGCLLVTLDVVIDADPDDGARSDGRSIPSKPDTRRRRSADAAVAGSERDGSETLSTFGETEEPAVGKATDSDSTAGESPDPVSTTGEATDTASMADEPTDAESTVSESTTDESTDGESSATEPTAGATAGDSASTSAAGTGSPDPSSLAAARDESVPPYEDTPYLQRLYESCDTFAEMSRRIEMDVSDETVRRYMIEAGIHSPSSYETDAGTADRTAESVDGTRSRSADDCPSRAAPSDAGGERTGADGGDSLPDDQLVADGIGFPDRLTLQDLVDAIVDARTVHEVSRELGLDHDRTRRLLRQLNVLDLVLRRVSEDPSREVSVEDVAARIRQSAPDGS